MLFLSRACTTTTFALTEPGYFDVVLDLDSVASQIVDQDGFDLGLGHHEQERVRCVGPTQIVEVQLRNLLAVDMDLYAGRVNPWLRNSSASPMLSKSSSHRA